MARELPMSTRKKKLAVEVAKDVLESIGSMDVRQGAFVQSSYESSTEVIDTAINEEDSRKAAEIFQRQCRVCALGACLLSAVKLHNKFNFSDANEPIFARFDIDHDYLFDRLKEVFTNRQMVLIENAFELGRGFFRFRDGDSVDLGSWLNSSTITEKLNPRNPDLVKQINKAVRFGKRYNGPRKRLAAIMRNIIKNGGEFIP